MPKKKPVGPQLETLPPQDMFQATFNLKAQDQFVTGLGVQFEHYAAVPSPIGLQDRGEYRRSGALDNISSNGMIYKKSGLFTATLVGNSDNKKWSISATQDESTARLIMPRYYDRGELPEGSVIRPSVGDRLYLADKDADVIVSTFQRMEYVPNQVDRPTFPIHCVQHLIDSRGEEYRQGVDFTVTDGGNISWMQGKSPGIDPLTGNGRTYSIRYTYRAHWYVSALINEVRITNITENGVRKPARMPYHVQIQREFVYINQANGGLPQANPDNSSNRTVSEPSDPISEQTEIKVNASDIYSSE